MAVRVGMASVAHLHAYSYASALRSLPDAELVAVYDPDPARGQSAADRFGVRYVAGYEDFLAMDLDAVVVCSENARHREMVEAAARAGKHVLCEKPLATRVEDGEAMMAACRQAGVILATAFPVRFVAAVARARELLADGAVGRILGVRGTNRGTMPGGWFVERELSGGGAIIDHTVHVVDLVRWMLGEEVVQVYAQSATRFHDLPVEDTGLLLMRLSSGATFSLDTSWSRTRSYPTWGDVTLEFVGTGGVLSVDATAQHLTVYRDVLGKGTYVDYPRSMDQGLIAAFVAAVQGRSVPELPSGEDGLAAAAVALAAYRSVAEGQPVLVSAARQGTPPA